MSSGIVPAGAGSDGTAAITSRYSSVVSVRRTPAACAVASSAIAAEWASATRNFEPLSFRMKASFAALVCGLTNVKAPPASSVPKIALADSAVLSR